MVQLKQTNKKQNGLGENLHGIATQPNAQQRMTHLSISYSTPFYYLPTDPCGSDLCHIFSLNHEASFYVIKDIFSIFVLFNYLSIFVKAKSLYFILVKPAKSGPVLYNFLTILLDFQIEGIIMEINRSYHQSTTSNKWVSLIDSIAISLKF